MGDLGINGIADLKHKKFPPTGPHFRPRALRALGRKWKPLGGFSCLRSAIPFLPSSLMQKLPIITTYLFRAKDPKNNASVLLRLFNDDFANKFEIQDAINKRQVIWFRAEVPVRQWNSMCLIRKFGQKFQIYQNNENVYSYGECRTVGPINDYYPTQVKDKPCHDKPQWNLNVSTN